MKTNFIKTLFVTLFLLSVNIVNAHDFVSNGIYYDITDATNKTVAVTYKGIDYDSYSNEYIGSVVIPESVSYNGKIYSVTSIGYRAFYDCDELTNITIPNSVTSIEEYAFYKCSGLTSITIPNSVTSIGDAAFFGCKGLKTVVNLSNLTFSKSSSDYGYVAYYADIVINDPKATFVGDFVFSTVDDKHTLVAYLGKATKITLPDNYNGENYVIGNDAFYKRSWPTIITIPNSVTSIGEEAFEDCSGLTSITIPNSVTSIGFSAFLGCSGLTSITIPNSVTSIGNSAFYFCSGLTSITIPNSVTSIGNYAFYKCSRLTSITIPNSVTSIGNSAFYGCSGLTSIEIPNSVTSIGEEAFYDCSNLKTVINLSNLTLSKGSSDYGYVAYYADKVINGAVVGDFLFSTVDDKHTLVAYLGKATEITLPDNYNGENYVIGEEAFYGCSGLTSITIPNSVTSIGNSAFEGCSGLTSITIPNSVTSIGYQAFYGCSGLTSITIPNSVTSIGVQAFHGCSGLTSITIPNSVISIGGSVFSGCSGLTSIVIPNSVTSIGGYAFLGCNGLKTVVNLSNLTFSQGSSDYGYVAYYANKVINAPGGDVVGDFVFFTSDGKHTLAGYLGNETEITLPDNYNGENYAIGDNVFKNNSSITSITIPNSVTSIGDAAFSGCSSLTNVTIGKGVINMGGGVFVGCPSITTITLLGEIPPVIINTDDNYEYDFTPQQYETVVLYVPEGALDVYKSAYVWKDFFNIKEFDNTGIENLEAGSFNGLSDVYYDLNGCIVDNPTKGIYIINGKKVLVK